ncbi:hypothetical protein QJS10_CPB18g01951 [Acorus calamus]|nr:hypothetical protein QJS10_CPB18g01951 [Acorus calamus]
MNTEGSSNMQKSGSMGQFVLDMHFLLEIARFGGYLCDGFVDASSDLIASIEAAFTESQSDPCGVIFDDAWASDAAKTSIERLLRIEETEILFIKEPSHKLEEDSVVHGDPGNSVEEDCYSPGDSIGLTVYIDDASETESLIQQNTVETELTILETSIAIPEDGDVDKEIQDANESLNRGDILQIPKKLEELVSGISANIDEESCDEQELDITVSVEESVTLTLVDQAGESNNLVVTMASLSTDEQFNTIGIGSSEMGVAEIGDSHISQGGDAITADLGMNNSETLSDVEEIDVVHGHDLDNLPCPEAANISIADYHSLETIIVCGREDREDNNLPEVTSSLENLMETKTTEQIKQADGKSLDPVSVENSNKQQERHETDSMEGDIGSRQPDEQENVRIVRSSGSKRKGAKENHRWK